MIGSDHIDSDGKVMKFERLLESSQHDRITHDDEDSDPITLWLEYIQYMKTTYPSNLLALFAIYKRCVHCLIHHSRYQQDQRFVRICVLYADRCEDSLDTFEQLYKRRVGVDTAMLWMTWAWVAEKNSKYKLAEILFRKAMEKKVEPADVVVKRFHQFRRRMGRRGNQVETEAKAEAEAETESVGPIRNVEKRGDDTNRSCRVRKRVKEITPHGRQYSRTRERESSIKIPTDTKKNQDLNTPLSDRTYEKGHAFQQRKITPPTLLNQKSTQKVGYSPTTPIFRPKRQKTEWVQPKVADISNVSPFVDRRNFLSEKLRSNQEEIHNHRGFGFDPNLLVQNGEDGQIIESCFERERAKILARSLRLPCSQVRDFNNLHVKKCDKRNLNESTDRCLTLTRTNSTSKRRQTSDAIDYDTLHDRDVEEAKIKLCGTGGVRPKRKISNVCLNLNQTTPRCLVRTSKKGGKVNLGGTDFDVRYQLGKGCFGTVFLCEVKSEKASKQNSCFALKVQRPVGCLLWEFLVLKMLQQRLSCCNNSKYAKGSLTMPAAYALSIYSDGGVMRMTAGSHSGLNLLDIVNFYKGNVPELIAIHYTHRMMLQLEILHLECKFLHCDIKPDNWIICTHPEFVSDVMLVDFGRAKELKILADGISVQTMRGQVATEGLECVAMRANDTWSFDVDTYGLCVCAHTLLFGTYMDIIEQGRKWKLKNSLRRYWQTPLWRLLFDTLINEPSASIRTHRKCMEGIRLAFEAHLGGRFQELKHLLSVQTLQLPRKKG